MNITNKLLTKNSYSRSGEKQNKIKKVVIHWVGNANTSATANRNYFENLKNTHKTYASSHYIIGLKGEIIKCIPENEVAFHAGSYSMNRKSIGIENCHPDWNGKFNDNTYKSLVELCADILKRYDLDTSALIRHYDVTGKQCPKYYVKNTSAWKEFKSDVAKKLNQEVKEEEKGSDEKVRKYKNGSTKEIVYSDTKCTIKLGSLGAYEQCDCFGVFKDRAMVRYKVDGTSNYKIGFVKWLGGVK